MIIAAIILIILGGWFYVGQYKKTNIVYTREGNDKNSLAVVQPEANLYDMDADGDGLKDWEEVLWKTDPDKKDTDGDGASDNEEIKAGRDPLKPGPNDKSSEKPEAVKKVEQLEQNETLTASYAKQFLAQYLTLKQQKGALTEEDKQKLVNSIIGSLDSQEIKDQYTASDLRISKNNSDAHLTAYAKKIKNILLAKTNNKENVIEAFENIIEILKNEENSPEADIGKQILIINKASSDYDFARKQLLDIGEVPGDFAMFHLDLVNGFNNLSNSLKSMADFSKDPLKAMVGRNKFEEEISRVYITVQEMVKNFDKKNISMF